MSSRPVINPSHYPFIDFLRDIKPEDTLKFPFTDSGLISESDKESREHLAVFVHGKAHMGGYNAVCQYIAQRYESKALKKLRSQYGMDKNNDRTLFHPFPFGFFDHRELPKGESFDKFIFTCSTYLNKKRLPQYGDIEGLCALAFELMALEQIILKVIERMRLELSPGEKGEKGYPIAMTTQEDVEKAISDKMWENSRRTVFGES
ncbi:hypothetical protein BGX38DRAFT_1334536 [Terfezia claveryi]|nr:hypothetical protein BGX38DRAFT_1334536 [Terfezia claveryi]